MYSLASLCRSPLIARPPATEASVHVDLRAGSDSGSRGHCWQARCTSLARFAISSSSSRKSLCHVTGPAFPEDPAPSVDHGCPARFGHRGRPGRSRHWTAPRESPSLPPSWRSEALRSPTDDGRTGADLLFRRSQTGEEQNALSFSQVFHLRPEGGSYYVANDIFVSLPAQSLFVAELSLGFP